jgi:hypothetical protein
VAAGAVVKVYTPHTGAGWEDWGQGLCSSSQVVYLRCVSTPLSCADKGDKAFCLCCVQIRVIKPSVSVVLMGRVKEKLTAPIHLQMALTQGVHAAARCSHAHATTWS